MADQVLMIGGIPLKVTDLGDGTYALNCVISNDVLTSVLTDILDQATVDGAIGTIPAGAVVMRRLVIVTTPWDTAATLQIGTAADPDRYVAADDVNLEAAGSYQVNDSIHETSLQTVLVDIEQAGATQGELVLVIEYLVL